MTQLLRSLIRETLLLEAAQNLQLSELYQLIFGGSPSAKAFRSLVNHMSDNWYGSSKPPPEIEELATKALPTIQAIRTNQLLKTTINQYGNKLPFDMPFSESNPVNFAAYVRKSGLRDLKKFLLSRTSTTSTALSAKSKNFLRDWMNTNIHHMPNPDGEIQVELEAYRPSSTLLLYRGIQFEDIGSLVVFTKNYGNTKKAFPFISDRFSSWSKSLNVAEKFGRYHAAASHNDAMFGWLSRVKNQKSYDGYGGFVIGARVNPEQCLVDINKTGITGHHGNEEEVIVGSNQKLVCKVYKIFGDVEMEVEEFLSSNKRDPQKFLNNFITLTVNLRSINDNIATFSYVPINKEKGTPKSSAGEKILALFRANLFNAKWIDEFSVKFDSMM